MGSGRTERRLRAVRRAARRVGPCDLCGSTGRLQRFAVRVGADVALVIGLPAGVWSKRYSLCRRCLREARADRPGFIGRLAQQYESHVAGIAAATRQGSPAPSGGLEN